MQNKIMLLFLFLLFVSSYHYAFSQGSHINCVITDGTNETMEAEFLFPDWYKEAYHNVLIKKKDYGNDIVLSMDFIINNTQYNNSNNYTDNEYTGVDDLSMLEFARIDIAYKLINTKECGFTAITGDTVSIRIIQKTPCYKYRFCQIPIDSIDTLNCCNMYNGENGWGPVNYTLKPGFEWFHQGGVGFDQNGKKVVFVNGGKYQCGYKCCEIKYKFICKTINLENPIMTTTMWALVGVEKTEFENSTCHEYYDPGNNCPMPLHINNYNPCKGDCNETHY